ncbi:hypothetical protein ACFFIY_10750 [Bhargavaea ullalensis]|uniref:Stage III sporulation protein AG n=1 Tax=Bhargavaea ullalensis TaxID=1265685 RepID=A0ABV2G934_9BACL
MDKMQKRFGLPFLLAAGAALLILFPALTGWGKGGGEVEAVRTGLESVLSEIQGVGSVRIYRQDAEEGGDSGMLSLAGYFGGGSTGTGDTPSGGVLVVAEGAGDPKVRNELVRILSGVLQLPEHRIVVVEMKKEGEDR